MRELAVARGLPRDRFMRTAVLAPLVIVASACARDEYSAEPVTAEPCTSARSVKLGTPFARLCPQDLPGIVSSPFWIAAAPLGCLPGKHETLLCAPIHPLTAMDPVVDASTAMLVDAGLAHRICVLRYGGRLPTAAERAQARDALGFESLLVTLARDRRQLALMALPEWVTDEACSEHSALGGCAVLRSPAVPTYVPWSRLSTCRATRTEAGAAATLPAICPRSEGACSIATGAPGRSTTFSLQCADAVASSVGAPEIVGDVAAFRCVLSELAMR
jgi:hypothetical protein